MTDHKKNYLLKRTGKRPLRFQGIPLVKVGDPRPDHNPWHEVNIYETDTGSFVVQIRVHNDSEDEPDIFRAEPFETVEDVTQYLQTYDPRADVSCHLPITDKSVSMGDLQSLATDLSDRLQRVENHYKAIIKSILPAPDDARSS